MTEHGPQPTPRADPRSAALARYLRETAAHLSLSDDATALAGTSETGMALLDAAFIAEAIPASDPRLRLLSEAGLFESPPHGDVAFVDRPEIREALRRPLTSDREGAAGIITKLLATAAAFHEPPAALHEARPGAPDPRPNDRVGATRPISLQALGNEIHDARSAHQRHRRSPASADLENSRHHLVLALENYVAALEDRNLPVPRSIHAELQLLRGLLRWWQ